MKRTVLAILLAFGFLVSACGQDVSDFLWVENNGEITITGYVGERTDVRIPRRINGMPVVSIGEGAFDGNRLTSVSIPNSVSHIGYRAFFDNRLTSITLPQNVDIQPNSFYHIVYIKYNLNGKWSLS